MEERLVNILNEMAEVLSVAQMKKLQEVLIRHLVEQKQESSTISNEEYLRLFLEAKKINLRLPVTLRQIQTQSESFQTLRLILR